MRWICATVAPWVLAAGLLVSFTAAASNDSDAGYSIRAASALRPLIGIDAPGAPLIADVPTSFAWALQDAALRFDTPFGSEGILHEDEPRPDLKLPSGAFPEVDRTRKGDPAALVQPSLSRRGKDMKSARGSLLDRDERLLPPTVLMRGPAQPPDLLAEPSFEIWHEDSTTTQVATSEQSPQAAAQGSTGIGRAGGATPGRDGATPAVPRALTLGSSTPAAASWAPVEIAAAPVSLPPTAFEGGASVVEKGGLIRPRFTDLVPPDKMERERRCLAEVVYFEARSESAAGQAAVAQVVLNRVRSSLYPGSICGVVYQNRHRHLACQFTFACEGKSLRITEPTPWRRAVRIANAVLEGDTYLEDVGGATHYHADYVNPRWASKLKKMDVIGRHIFYKLRPGQR